MWNKRLNKPLLWALIVSALLHGWLIGRSSWLQWQDEDADRLVIELIPAPPAPVPEVKSSPKPRVERKHAEPALPPADTTPLQAPSPVRYAASEETIPVEQAAVEASPSSEPVESAEPTVEPAPQVARADPQEDVSPPEKPEQADPPPYFVAIDFDILRKGGVVGSEHHVYDYGDNGYTLTSIAKPRGLYALALSELTQKSEGKVTAQGLRPERFTYQYGKNPDKAQRVWFDWNQGRLFMQAGARKQEAALSEGAQDLMSFMYQFMFEPPLQKMELAIANGKRFKTYDYAFEGEENIVTPVGRVHALHIVHSGGDGEEKTELWLARDYHYLPLKIRKTEKDGTVLERIATHVQME